MWEIHNLSQISGFMYAMILGSLFSLFYDVFRSFRSVKTHSIVLVFIEDLIYFFIIAILSFIFFLSITAGEIRGYILIGILVGFLCFYILLSRYCIYMFTFIFNTLFNIFKLFSKWFYIIFAKIDRFFTKYLKNKLKCYKKGLKKLKVLLYTSKK